MSQPAALLGAEYDTPDRGGDPPAPISRYVICSTQRCGSSLLCQALLATGVAGTPTEYLNADVRAALAQRWGCGGELESYVRTLLARRTSPAGVFATKLHWDQFEQLRAETLGLGRAEPEFEIDGGFLKDLLGGPLRYVHILRRDVNRQAVSFWTALRTGVWSVWPGDPERRAMVEYSFDGIDRCRRLIENAELHWDRFFRFNGIDPYEVVYEDLESEFEATIDALVRHVVPTAAAVSVAPAQSKRLRDERSETLLRRYADDREARGLEDPLAPPPAAPPGGRAAQLERELAMIASSRSWRLTRPLRELRARTREMSVAQRQR